MKSFKIPHRLTPSHIEEFLDTFEVLFSYKPSNDEALYIAKENTEISILGATALYKAINYASLNKCFNKWRIACDNEFRNQFALYGLSGWIDHARLGLNSSVEQLPNRIYATITDQNRYVTPLSLSRRDMNREAFIRSFLEVVKYYYKDQDLIDMIYGCLSELLSNFWEHAIFDPRSILLTEYSKSNIKIACTDTGNGIVRTLRESNIKYVKYEPHEILAEAVKRSITSKPGSNHLGLGLWILDRMATMSGGFLHIYSQGGFYRNAAGKTSSGKCGYWDGTIMYLNLPLNKVIPIHSILEEEADLVEIGLKLNFV